MVADMLSMLLEWQYQQMVDVGLPMVAAPVKNNDYTPSHLTHILTMLHKRFHGLPVQKRQTAKASKTNWNL